MATPPPPESEYSELWSFYQSTLAIDVMRYSKRQVRLRLPFVPCKIFGRIIDDVTKILKTEDTLLGDNGNFVVVGDLRGSVLGLLRILQKFGFPPKQNYVFLGNMVNGNEFNVQVLTILFVMKILWPSNVLLLRGRQEFDEMCDQGGLRAEVEMLYGPNSGLYKKIMTAFSWLPLAAVINDRAFCVSGGIGRNISDLGVISDIPRPIDLFKPVVVDLMWAEPTDLLPMFLPASRERGVLFGRSALEQFLSKTDMKMVIRGCEPVPSGCETKFGGGVISVFSTSLFEGRQNGSGVYVLGLMNEKPESFGLIPEIKRNNCTYVMSVDDERFCVENQQSITVHYRDYSANIIPACGGLKMSAARHGSAKDLTRLRKAAPPSPARSTRVVTRRSPIILPTVQKVTLDWDHNEQF